MNYFELYNLPETFSPDAAAVKRRFYELSKRYHPDFYINEPAEKQQEILELSTLNNKAYQVLSDRRKCTAYILELHGLLEEGDKYRLPQEFLMEMMEVNEGLMELEFEPDAAALQCITAQVIETEDELNSRMHTLHTAYDAAIAGEKEAILLQVRDIWYRQKYLLRIRESLAKFATRT